MLSILYTKKEKLQAKKMKTCISSWRCGVHVVCMHDIGRGDWALTRTVQRLEWCVNGCVARFFG